MIAIAVDAATYAGSVALWRDAALIGEADVAMRGVEQERLMPAVASLIERGGVRTTEIARVYCGSGPGSFTSLRIAASIAKGLALGSGAELWAVPSLGLTVAASEPPLSKGRYFSVLDALRGEWYGALFEVRADGAVVELAPARLVSAADLEEVASDLEARVVGPGRALDRVPRARGALPLAEGGSATRVDLDTWEPAYGRLAEAQVKWEAAHGRPLPRT